jgi:hypothetical protein
MFDGERIVMQKEVLTRDVKFLVSNGAFPKAKVEFPIKLISRTTTPEEVIEEAQNAYRRMTDHINFDIEHEIREAHRSSWRRSNAGDTKATLEELFENQHKQIKAYDVSREMFGALGSIYHWIDMSDPKTYRYLIDVALGTSTRLGDGQRHHLGDGRWGFSQMKGLRAHTTHLYLRGLAK